MTASRTITNNPQSTGPAVAAAFWLLATAFLLGTGCQPAAPGGPAGGGGSRAVNVLVAEATRQPVSETLPLVGSILANEMVEIRSEIEGSVESIHFQEGEFVEAGDLLIELDRTKLAAALAEAEANYELSRANYRRNQELFNDELISRQEYDQFNAAFKANEASLALKRRQLMDTSIRAPFSGTVGSRNVSPGQVIDRNTILTWLVDLHPVKVEINVPERFVGQLRRGQTLDLNVAAFPGRRFQGEVFFIAPFVDLDTRTALVKARIPNPEKELLPGMFANLDLTLELRERSLVIPEQAITKLLDEGRALLYVVDDQNQADMRRVRLGVRMPGHVEVLEGLAEGDRVIVEGTQKIGPGSPVQIVRDEAPALAEPAAESAAGPEASSSSLSD